MCGGEGREKRGGMPGVGRGEGGGGGVSLISRERTEACGGLWPLKCGSTLSSRGSL